MTTAVAVVLLAAVLLFATLRPKRLPEAVAGALTVPACLLSACGALWLTTAAHGHHVALT